VKSIVALASLLLIPITAIVNADDSICTQFHDKLIQLPHNQLILNTNGFVSLFNGKPLDGCEVIYESKESLVSGDKVHDLCLDLINTDGWTQNNEYAADGPGSSSVGIENDRYRCVIHWSQHAWIDDKTNEIKQSDQIRIVVQCLSK